MIPLRWWKKKCHIQTWSYPITMHQLLACKFSSLSRIFANYESLWTAQPEKMFCVQIQRPISVWMSLLDELEWNTAEIVVVWWWEDYNSNILTFWEKKWRRKKLMLYIEFCWINLNLSEWTIINVRSCCCCNRVNKKKFKILYEKMFQICFAMGLALKKEIVSIVY